MVQSGPGNHPASYSMNLDDYFPGISAASTCIYDDPRPSTAKIKNGDRYTSYPVQRLATGWTVRGSNPGAEARFSAPVETGPGAYPSLLYNGYRVFIGGKAAGAWC